jgi:PAS domain S-box-containing protein
VLVAALFVVDLVSGEETVLVTLFVAGPLLAAIRGGPRGTFAVAAAATALSAIALIVHDTSGGQDAVRMASVVLGSGLAVVIAALRTRLGLALGRLDALYERTPVGIGLLDTDLDFVRVNGRLAEFLPHLPSVQADLERVLRTETPLGEVPVTGGSREWLASFWPVRRAGDDELVGVGVMVVEVTQRRAAERALQSQTDRYESLLRALSEVGEGMVVLDQDGACVYANHAFEQLSGYTFPELAAMHSMFDLVVESDRDEARLRALLRAERNLVEERYPLAMRRRDGARVELELAGVPLEVDGSRQLVVVVRDVTARRRAETERERALARTALLAEASELFDQSLEEQLTLARVARLCVRDLADTCVIMVGDSTGTVRRVAAAARVPAREPALLDADPMHDVLRSSRGVVAPAPEGLGTPWAVIVPLRARGRVHGVLAAGFDELDEQESGELLALFEDLGRRAALALDTARLYEERDHVARTLQRSLLPAELPEIPGLELAARYVAAGAGNEVGGDFYDCFPTGGGDWAAVIGDVCGKGAEAAAVTALARHTLRAAVLHTQRPREVLGELNEALLRQQLDYRFCTVLYAALTPRSRTVTATVATGGHPLPLVLRAGGTVETAGTPGTLLGIVAEPDVSEETVELEPGDALVLFTDGAVEATPDHRASGPERLADLLATCAGAGAARIAEAVENDTLEAQGGLARDDVAVVVVRVLDAAAASFAQLGEGVAAPT